MLKNTQPEETQGSLFTATVVHSGATDPTMHSVKVQLDVEPDGAFPAQPVQAYSEPAGGKLAQAVHEAVVTDHRRQAQSGKHSPLAREGDYTSPQVGDYLPGFGPVTYRNAQAARQHADGLERQRLDRRQ